MLAPGPAKKATIYINEDAKHHKGSLYEAILEYLKREQVAGVTASRAIAGFGSGGIMHTQRSELLSEHLPIRIEFIDREEKVRAVLPGLQQLVGDGIIEVQDTIVLHSPAAQVREPIPHEVRRGPGKLMHIFLGEADQAEGRALYETIVDHLRGLGIAGATVHRGILGYGAKGHTHRLSFFHLSRDLPLVVSVVDTAEKIEAAARTIEAMLEDGLIVVSDVEMTRVLRGSR